jgi:coenzyme Q-binding protein COQ10
MPHFSSKRRVHHTASQMFDLVADVERYPEFVPLCQSLKVRQRTPAADGKEVVVADMTVSFKLVRETFTSKVTLDRPNRKILVEYLRGPFSHLENRLLVPTPFFKPDPNPQSRGRRIRHCTQIFEPVAIF